MGRPPKPIDGEMIERLAALFASQEDIALIVGCSVDTLARRYADVIAKGRAHARTSLRRAQFEVAIKGNPYMLAWLGKQILGQADRLDHTGAVPLSVVVRSWADVTPKKKGATLGSSTRPDPEGQSHEP